MVAKSKRIASQIAFHHKTPNSNDKGTGAEACTQLALAARCTTKGIVEFGTWAGHSTRCLGLGANVTGIPNRLFGFDNFVAGGSNWKKFANTPYMEAATKGGQARFNIQPVLEDYVKKQMYPTPVTILHSTFLQ